MKTSEEVLVERQIEKTCVECHKPFMVCARGAKQAVRCPVCREAYLKGYRRNYRKRGQKRGANVRDWARYVAIASWATDEQRAECVRFLGRRLPWRELKITEPGFLPDGLVVMATENGKAFRLEVRCGEMVEVMG